MKKHGSEFPCWYYHKTQEAILVQSEDHLGELPEGYGRWGDVFGVKVASNPPKAPATPSKDDSPSDSGNSSDVIGLSVKQLKAELSNLGVSASEMKALDKEKLAALLEQKKGGK